MALTQEDLQAIQGLLTPINARLDAMQADITGLKDDVSTLKDDVSTLKDDVSTLKDDVSSLKKDMAHHNHYVEPLLKAVKDGIDGVLEHNRQLDRLVDRVEEHDHRIWALEQTRKA